MGQFTTLDGLRIHYEIGGSGPPLLMFAPGGFGSVYSKWTAKGGNYAWKQMDGLATLSKHFTTIAYDRREAGLSGGRIEPLHWGLYCDEAMGMLALAGHKRAYILGSCMGVSVALAFAVRHPEACIGLLLHWPVGGYQWMMRAHGFFQRHFDFVAANGLEGVAARAKGAGKNFWTDPESGPWAGPLSWDETFQAQFVKQDVKRYLEICRQSRDTLFNDTMPSGATGAELMKIEVPSIIMSGADSRHTRSASWTLKELMPKSELWDICPPAENGENLLAELLRIKTYAPA
jgi:pimeloyl-ACP methyl ester carboxylesterase